jgi:hypothetical protein
MRDLLTVDGMREVRTVLIARYRYFTHISAVENFDGIQRGGLERRMPGGLVPSAVRDSISDKPEEVVCLWPRGSLAMNVQKHGQTTFALALASEALPQRLGLDWSHDSWRMACVRRRDDPRKPSIEIFLEVVAGSGSIVSYDPIPPTSLLVCPIGLLASTDPVHWRRLDGSAEENIQKFPPLFPGE